MSAPESFQDAKQDILDSTNDGISVMSRLISWLGRAVDELRASGGSPDIVGDLLRRDGGGVVDVLGKLVDRLPETLTVAEVCLVLDSFDVSLRGHDGSSRVGASAGATADASEPTLEAAPGTSSLSGGVSGAPSAHPTQGVWVNQISVNPTAVDAERAMRQWGAA